MEGLQVAVRSLILLCGDQLRLSKMRLTTLTDKARISEYSASIAISPHVFKKVVVPEICVGWIGFLMQLIDLRY
jgi:hypothetical protein